MFWIGLSLEVLNKENQVDFNQACHKIGKIGVLSWVEFVNHCNFYLSGAGVIIIKTPNLTQQNNIPLQL